MRVHALILSLCVWVAGCATYSQVFVNADGHIMQCAATGQGVIGMATASNAVRSCTANMLAAGYIEIERAGVIGVSLSTSEPGSPVRILKVADLSPAQAAGIRPGEQIISIDGQPVLNVTDAKHLLFGLAGTEVEVVILKRDEKKAYRLLRAPFPKIYGAGSSKRPAASREN